MTDQMTIDSGFDIAVIGAGSAASSFITSMESSDVRIVVFEPGLVGGECPFFACIPSKSLLHDRKTGRSWDDAVARRDELVSHLDDTSHAEPLRDAGATIVRERAKIVGAGLVEAADTRYQVDHVVVATGAVPTFPDIDGLDREHPRVWSHRDVLTSSERPDSLIVLGGGVIGTELAFMYAGFGTETTTLDQTERPFPDLHRQVGEIVADVLTDAGVAVVNGVKVERVELSDSGVVVHVEGSRSFSADQLLVATGRLADLSGLGLESVGIDPDAVEIDKTGRVLGADDDTNVWVIGDAAGRGQYTHLANHHGVVVADQISGNGQRRFGDVVTPACIFLDPPVMMVGPTWDELDGDDDVVRIGVEVETPRHSTDERRPGFIAAAADRTTGCIVAAHGIGAGMDDIVHAFVVAIDGQVPVARLRQTLQAFPTFGGGLDAVYEALHDELVRPG